MSGLLRGSLVVIGLLVNTAPLGEVGLMPAPYNKNTTNWEGNKPHPLSGHGPYSSCGCPALGWVWTALLLTCFFALLGQAIYGRYTGPAVQGGKGEGERQQGQGPGDSELGVL